jgi:hypothetical protein
MFSGRSRNLLPRYLGEIKKDELSVSSGLEKGGSARKGQVKGLFPSGSRALFIQKHLSRNP